MTTEIRDDPRAEHASPGPGSESTWLVLHGNRTLVLKTLIGTSTGDPIIVSSVVSSICHNDRGAPLVVWETRVFGGHCDGRISRVPLKDGFEESMRRVFAGHAAMIETIASIHIKTRE